MDVERAKRLTRLIGKRCAQVCEIFEVFEHDDLLYVAMEHVPGEALTALLLEEGPLEYSVPMKVAPDVLAGPARLYDQGVVHRDVSSHT